MAKQIDYDTPIIRYYVDTRPLVQQNSGGNIRTNRLPLPLLSTLPEENQNAITRFLRVEDKLMSLASALLKFTFIHRIARVPWSDIQISKTPAPHGRPFWDPLPGWQEDGFAGVEFNVSHQAGIVILAGCHTPSRPDMSLRVSQQDAAVVPDPAQQRNQQIRIGVDVACTREPRRTPDLSTQAKLDEWVDTFAEMFSLRERQDMKQKPVIRSVNSTSFDSASQTLEAKARRFYTYWALKEAYIKMVGEGLLADWLRQLEFVDVVSPNPGEKLTARETGMKTMFKGRDISGSVEVELEGMEDTFLFTTVTRGIAEKGRDRAEWVRLELEKDIKPCAEGRCSCLT